MQNFRKIIFWMHLISGLLAGILIFIMCISGALLSFKSNIIDFAESDMRYIKPPAGDAKRLPIREILEKVKSAKPDKKSSNITIKNERDAAAIVSFGRDGQVFVNPYNGEITGEGASGWRGFFRFVEDTHRWLALEGTGKTVGRELNDAANVLFLFLAISGVYIWFPRKLVWKNFKSVLWFRRGLNGKARNFNWHNVIGFWSSLVLIILTATAIVMSYNWANNLVYTLTGNDPPERRGSGHSNAGGQEKEKPAALPENLEAVWTTAENHTPWKSISLSLPIEKEAEFNISEGKYRNKFGRSSLTIDPNKNEVSKWEPYGEQNAGRQLRSWIRFTHTGETGGIIGQFIGFLACIGGAFLVWTGFSLALQRFQSWRRKSVD